MTKNSRFNPCTDTFSFSSSVVARPRRVTPAYGQAISVAAYTPVTEEAEQVRVWKAPGVVVTSEGLGMAAARRQETLVTLAVGLGVASGLGVGLMYGIISLINWL